MEKNYNPIVLLVAILGVLSLHSQEIKIFSTADFDLKGTVKNCLVSTSYGKEDFTFNETGLLTKSVTRYNDNDYDITYYKYSKGELIEKRLENYRDKVFDEGTSIANFYTIDTAANRKVTEKIVSYKKEFLDQYEYLYDADDRLIRIVRSNDNGIDETIVRYNTYRSETTVTYEINGEKQKSIRTSFKKGNNNERQQTVLTKKFLNGAPHQAIEEILDEGGKVLSKTDFLFDNTTKQFTPEVTVTYVYDSDGILSTTKTVRGDQTELNEYVHQFDGEGSGNWVKQIIKPNNSYTTRKISYYEVLDEAEE